jgi:HlyD family secretion protein
MRATNGKDFMIGLANKRMMWLALVIVAAGGIWYFFFARPSTGKVTYETAAVDRGDIETSVASSGSVSPLVTVTVGSEVSGKLIDVIADFNSKVTKGQLLAQIDPSTFKSKRDSAQADLLVQEATAGSREVDVSNAQVALDQAKRDNDRAKSLSEKGLVSANDVEKARNAFEQAQNNVKIAQANLNNARSQIVKVKATLQQMRLDLARTEIRSPVDGVVISRKVDTGQTVQASMQAPELFQIAKDLSLIQIETKVDEADIGSIKDDARATFTVDAFPDRSFTGRVAQIRINGTSLQNVVTYSVMVQASNPNQMLLPGMTANVKILTADKRGVLRVASGALRFRPAGANALPEAGAVRSGGGGNAGGGQRGGGGGFGGGPPGGGFGGPGGPGGGGGGGGRSTAQRAGPPLVQMTPEVMKELGLTEEQQAKVTEAMKGLVQRAAPEAGGAPSNPLGGGGMPNVRMMGGNNNSDTQLMRTRMMNALASLLTDEQMQKYQAMGSSTAVRPATIYVLNAKGQPEARSIRVGLSTDSQTEVLSGLNEGDKVIVRARTEQKG